MKEPLDEGHDSSDTILREIDEDNIHNGKVLPTRLTS